MCKVESFYQKNEFDLSHYVSFSEEKTDAKDSASGIIYSTLKIGLNVRRRSMYWLLNFCFPVALVSLYLGSSYAIPADAFPDRLTVDITAFLTMNAFKLQVSDKLPFFQYLSLCDWYVMSLYCLSALVTFQQFLASSTINMYHEASETSMSLRFFVVFILLHFLFSVAVIWKRIQQKSCLWYLNQDTIWIGPLNSFEKKEDVLQEIKRFFRVNENGPESVVIHENVWSGAEASKYCDSMKLRQYCYKKAFAVVQFSSEESAVDEVSHFNKIDFLNEDVEWVNHTTRAEIIHPSWRILAKANHPKELFAKLTTHSEPNKPYVKLKSKKSKKRSKIN